jgi:hypothetical protein
MDVAEWKSIDEQKDGENDQLAGLNSHLGGKSDLFKGLKSQKETTTTGEQTGAWQPQQHPAEAGQGSHLENYKRHAHLNDPSQSAHRFPSLRG